MPDYLMAVDVGTTGANAMLIAPDGGQYGVAYREYASFYPAEHHVEQDAEMLVANAFAVCREAVEQSHVAPQDIKAVGITSHRATFGLLGADNRLINGRFIVWQDNRAHSVLDEMATKMAPTELYRITGMPLTPTYSLEKLVWFKRHQPEIYAEAKKIIFPADYVLWRFGADELTTEATNACCSGMIDVHRLDWSDEVLHTFEIERSKFTPLVYPGTILGRINAQTSALTGLKEGTPLVSTTGDQQCAAVGAGVIDEGLASLTLGTAGLLVVATRKIELEKNQGLMAPSSGLIGLYELEGIQLGAAACYRWIRDQFAIPEIQQAREVNIDPYQLMEKRLEESVPGSQGIMFLPFLAGAGYPLWDPMAQGTFAGLRFAHNRSDMIRSVIEGVTLESFDMYQKIRNAGVDFKSLTVTGGATTSPIWRQTIADIFDMDIRPLKTPNATLVAAAIFAGVGAGVYKNVADGVAQAVHFTEPIHPIPKNVEVFKKNYDVYTTLTEALQSQGIFKRLVQLRGE